MKERRRVLRCGIAFAALALLGGMASPRLLAAEPAIELLFDSGKEGYPRYRIPALIVTPEGTVLAFCEGRKDGHGLTGNIDLVLKRSTDSGQTWGELERMADDGDNTLGNPCVLVDRDRKTLWLAFTRSLGGDTEEEIVAGESRDPTRVFITSSTDDGKTWKKPTDITSTVKKPDWTWYGTGPGTGIQLTGGRLIVPAYHVERSDGIYRSHVIYSDDHGQTWQLGGVVGDNTSECHVVERNDGTLYLDTRTVVGKEQRTGASSLDEGRTWRDAALRTDLYDPHCQACTYRWPSDAGDEKAKPLWLFTHPAGPGRRNLTLRYSDDEGKTWSAGRLLQPGDSQYTSLARLPDGHLGCLYERWTDGNYRLFFARVELEWVRGTAPKP